MSRPKGTQPRGTCKICGKCITQSTGGYLLGHWCRSGYKYGVLDIGPRCGTCITCQKINSQNRVMEFQHD